MFSDMISLSLSVPELRTLLSAALERVNLDLVFEADSEDNGAHSHTASYLLLWLILIEIMSHCGPEVRGMYTVLPSRGQGEFAPLEIGVHPIIIGGFCPLTIFEETLIN